MRRVQLVFVLGIFLVAAGCSKSGGGSGAPGDLDSEVGEGNIPIASEGTAELNDVNFAYDSATLSESSRDILKSNADFLRGNPDDKVVIEGHCDERGTVEYNLALGERRARSVRDYLRSLGVNASQLDIISYGEELPLVKERNEAAYARNRRAHFEVKR